MIKQILKYTLIGLLCLIAVLIVFGIVMVLGWPWWVGIFILLGLVGLGIAVYVIKQILIKRREQKFVSQIIEQDEASLKAMKDDERRHFADLQERFREAVDALKGSHLKKLGNPLYVLPWYMVIGESASGKTTAIKSAKLSSPFAEMTLVSGMSGTRNCDWWFFEQAVIIDTAGRYAIPVDEGRDKEEWQRFLNLLAKYRKKEPLNGLVVTVAADRLLKASPDELAEDGRQIRRRIDELMRVLGSKFPVYVLVTKCDLVQGMTQFCGELDDDLLNQAMGVVNHDLSADFPGFVARAMHTITERLTTLRLLIFHRIRSKTLEPALLLFPEEFSMLKPKVEAFMNGAFQVNPYQETPMLRGIYFSSGRQEGSPYSHFLNALGLIESSEVLPGTSKGLFLHDFFARILPAERGLFAPTRQALAWERLTLNLGLLAWVAVGIAVCGLLSFSFVKNLGIIRGFPVEFTRAIVLKGEMGSDLMTMDRYRGAILTVHEKNSSWLIPRLGLTESRDAEKRLKKNYCGVFDSRFLELYDKQLAVDIRSIAPNEQRVGEYVVYLVHRINLLKARLNDEDLSGLLSRPMVVLSSSGLDREGAKRFMDLYSYRLMWEEDSGTLRKESADLEAMLADALAKAPNFQWIPAWINGSMADSTVTLSAFWGGGINPGENIRIDPAFTLAGKAAIDSFLLDLESALDNPASVAPRKAEFLTWYRDTYREAWHTFGLNFAKGMDRLKGAQEWRAAAVKAASVDGLYFLVLKRMADELKPFSSDPVPGWMRLVYDFDRTRAIAAQLQTGAIAKATETASKLKEKIQESIGKEKTLDTAGNEYEAGKSLRDYENALSKISAAVCKSRASAFQAATVVFGDDPSASPFMAAQGAYSRLSASGSVPSEPFWRLVYGPFDFLWAYTCRESACHLQGVWEKEVLVDIQGISDPSQLNQLLFAPDGLATKFIKGAGAPFVGRDLKRGYYAKEVFGRSLPFEQAFLSFYSRAKVGLPVAAMAASASDNSVTVAGLPTEANDNARVQPHATRLTLQCMDSQQSVVNMNYPVSKVLTWSTQKCGGVIFSIEVGNLTLTKNYSGPEAFAKFLMEFPGGSHTFSPDDFPKEASHLRGMGIRYIKVQYRFSGQQAVINQARPSMSQPTTVPLTILRCMPQ
ncbi:MAG TPA: type VI secretion protein IcmF/TssM N-terminal domain-containing protein [Desulfomonilia bacterium]|nr:type VI secretion protein IcmF/TssM N-terminal domain-containing protein [Desulfomonilia bacterium]